MDLRQNERANLKRCLGGLLYQSYTNLEILVLTKGTLTKQQAEFLAEFTTGLKSSRLAN
ncbi:glycosyltransferase family A protein [Ligilactobacillus agilis]|uniref:glycosyltransferase family A protein n=1 Tax=Ligilactobacillus agilis TaxID=1601 RepID=UPI00320795CA